MECPEMVTGTESFAKGVRERTERDTSMHPALFG